ncbi:MAG: transcription termination/antitermination protein NusG [Candidatus Omnitrophica bacterium]|nr:transcription termination/antitermination protein NusG [Candidatus Omnitrophota bacterium]HOX54187.1 transcription termination/antitermination protein NusG [Candidatus Omnitrophota bacterium]
MKKWYVLHTQTGSEEKVKSSIENKITSTGLNDLVGEVVIPTEQISEIRGGKKNISRRKFFPGYILINMDLTEKSWYLIKTTPGITGFIGAGRRPTPLTEAEVDNILKKTRETESKPSPKVIFETGEAVRIIEGPFTNFNGTIDEISPARGKLKVGVSIFGRVTPVELEYWQVEKI